MIVPVLANSMYLRDLAGWESCMLESKKWEGNNVLLFPEKTLAFPYDLIRQNVIKQAM